MGFEACQTSPSEYVKLTLAPPGTAFGTPRREWIAATAAQTAYRLSGGQGADSEYYLKTLRELIEITRLTGPARFNALLILQNRFTLETAHWNRHRSRTFAEPLFEAVKKDQRIATLLRSAAIACAIERFRAAHQDRLPNSLADRVPTYLAGLPLDPYDDRPLRFRPLNPGYVVYGIGPDGEDNQGNSVPKLRAGDTGLDIPFTVER